MGEANQPRILVVEDDPDIRETLAAYLERSGYVVGTADNGQAALEVLEGGALPCLILLDMMMPVMDGWTFLSALDERGVLAQVPITVVTAYADDTPIERVEEVLHKPVDLQALMETVREHCGPGLKR